MTLILPPSEIRAIIDKLGAYVARNGPAFEDKIFEKERHNPRFSFLYPQDPYHPYYQKRLQDFKEADLGETNRPDAIEQGMEQERGEEKPTEALETTIATSTEERPERTMPMVPPKEPKPLDFLLDLPVVSALDYDVIKLTAQFVARNGRQFMLRLAQREQRNPQFDFLKPNHSLHSLFQRLVDQYTRIIMPSRAMLAKLEVYARERFEVLERIKERVEYTRYTQQQQHIEEEEAERERLAFARIDWNDFVVAETIDFAPQDRTTELPRPLDLSLLKSMTIVQRKELWSGNTLAALGILPSPSISTGGADGGGVEGSRRERTLQPLIVSGTGQAEDMEMEMEVEMEMEAEVKVIVDANEIDKQKQKKSKETMEIDQEPQRPSKMYPPAISTTSNLPTLPPTISAPAIVYPLATPTLVATLPTTTMPTSPQLPIAGLPVKRPMPIPPPTTTITSATSTAASIKIREDYVPKAVSRASAVRETTEICPLCNQALPASQIEEHMRIEALDPKWREQREAYLAKHRETNLLASGTEVARNLRVLNKVRAEHASMAEQDLVRNLSAATKAAAQSHAIWDGYVESASFVTREAMLKTKPELIAQMNVLEQTGDLTLDPHTSIGPRKPTKFTPSSQPPSAGNK